MRPIVVNADYDEILAGGTPKPAHVLAIECLAFWVQDAPVKTQHDYTPEFFSHVEKHSGRKPRSVKKGEASNWWGELRNVELEKQINSKIWARQWWQRHYDLPGVVVYDPAAAFEALPSQGAMLLKRDHGMSGRGHWKTTRDQWQESQRRLSSWFPSGVIVEPLYQRTADLSALWLPEEKRFIYYRNLVDERFQWRGCVIENYGEPRFTDEEEQWLRPWRAQLQLLASNIQHLGYQGPFSVDAFFYQQDGQLRFYPCSEVNARKTMGWIAYHLLPLSRTGSGQLEFRSQRQMSDLCLSPAGNSFQWTWSQPAQS